MKALTPLIICLIIMSMSAFYPAVEAAQTTAIYQITAPSAVVAGSQNPLPVTVTVFYNNTVPGDQLIVGILYADLSPATVVPGIVTSSTDPCAGGPMAYARCAVTVPKPSGVERIDFQIGGIFGGSAEPGSWELNVTSVLKDAHGSLIPSSVSSRLFRIGLTTVALNVDVPSNVTVSVDGVAQAPGSVSIGVALGQHTVTVPQLVNVSESTRLRFDHWSDGSPSTVRSVVISNSTTLQADYVTQNLLTLIGVGSNATISTWYDADSNATFSTNQYAPLPGTMSALGAKLAFQGWYENGQLFTRAPTGTVSMNKPHTLTAVWQADYLIPTAVTLGIIGAAIIALLILQRKNRTPKPTRRLRKRHVRRSSVKSSERRRR